MQQAQTLPVNSLPETLTRAQVQQLLVEIRTKEVLDTDAAAAYLGVSKPLLELLRVQGGGPRYAKLGRLVRYRRDSLDDWLIAHERSHTSSDNAPSQ